MDFDGTQALVSQIANLSGESIQYSTDSGATWATVNAGATASVSLAVTAQSFRLRRGTAGGYLLAVDVTAEVQGLPVTFLNVGGSSFLVDSNGQSQALSEAQPTVALTATGTAFTGACEYAGFRVRAIVGASQTVTVYDATSATGTPIHTETVSAVGYFPWAGNKRRINGTGCHVVISGGTSRTIDVLVGA
jgi:hypothetical protein